MKARALEIGNTLRKEVFIALRFGVVGLLSTMIHMVTAWILIRYGSIHALIANTLAFSTAFTCSFVGHYFWTFRSSCLLSTAICRFLIIALSGFAGNSVLLAFLLKMNWFSETASTFTAIAVIPLISFLASRFWGFKEPAFVTSDLKQKANIRGGEGTILSRLLRPLPIGAAGVFIIYQYTLHQLVFPYHDDWGYAVLSYSTEQLGFSGQNFSQYQLLRFLYEEYMNWSGKVFAFFIQINLFKFGLNYVRMAQVAVLGLIVVFTMKNTVEDAGLRHPLAIVPMLCILALPEYSTLGGLYWFSASVAYVWGIPFFFMGMWLLKEKGCNLVSLIFFVFSAGFHEQMAFGVSVGTAAYFFLLSFPKFNKKRMIRQVFFMLPILAVSMLVIFAPGNFNRKQHSAYPSDSTVELIATNLNSLASYFTKKPSGLLFSVIVAVSFIFMAVILLKGSRGKAKLKPFLISALLLIGSFVFSRAVFLLIFCLLYGLALWEAVKRFALGKAILAIYIAALASLFMLLFAPGVSGRALLVFECLVVVPVTAAFVLFYNQGGKFVAVAVAVCLLPFAFAKTAKVYVGYKTNYVVNYENHSKLVAASSNIRQNITQKSTIHLKKLKDPRFAETMPYDRPLIEKWMKKYYRLPPYVVFDWQ